MNALELISIVESQGAEVKLNGELLHVVNGQCLPPEIVNLLKQHKPDLLAFLTAGSAPMIEPQEHGNDALTTQQQRAIDGLEMYLNKKRHNLIKGGYAPDNALVTREEWRSAVRRRLNLNSDRMDRLENELYQVGAIGYEASRLYVVVGDWQHQTHIYSDNPDFILSDDTGATFCSWFYQ